MTTLTVMVGTAFASASATSDHLDSRTAATEIAHTVAEHLSGPCHLALLFSSFHHNAAMAEARSIIESALSSNGGTPPLVVGTTAESVLGSTIPLEGRAGMALLAMSLPDARLHPFITTPDDPIRLTDPDSIPERIGLASDHRATLMFADPFSCPMPRLLPAMTTCRGPENPTPIIGAMASGSNRPGMNALVCGPHMLREGGVGVTINGGPIIDTLVSQGCKAIGSPMVITKAHEHTLLELGGRRAFDVVQELASELDESDRKALGGGLLIGSVLDESKTHFGRGDFLIRSALGFDKRVGGIKTGERHRIGRTVQFHVRDATTAREDLNLLYDLQQLKDPPFAALLLSCTGRGSRLFGRDHENFDAELTQQRFPDCPMVGISAAGEIAPVNGTSYLHGHTACVALLRPDPSQS